MSKAYSQEVINFLLEQGKNIIVVLRDDSVYIGRLVPGYGPHYRIEPPIINDCGMGFARGDIKQIVLFNGLIFPREMNGPHKILDILELNELVNKAGYEFI